MKNPKTAMMTMDSLSLVCALIEGGTFTGAVEKPTEPEETIPTETTVPVETTLPTETASPAYVHTPILKKPESVLTTIDPEDPYYDYYALLDIGGEDTNWIGKYMGIVFDPPEMVFRMSSRRWCEKLLLYGSTGDRRTLCDNQQSRKRELRRHHEFIMVFHWGLSPVESLMNVEPAS